MGVRGAVNGSSSLRVLGFQGALSPVPTVCVNGLLTRLPKAQ